MNANIPRWIKSSLAVHFSQNLDGKFFYLEGDPRSETQPVDRFELRVDGPSVIDHCASSMYYEIDLNLLVVTQVDTNYIYKHETWVGIGQVACGDSIPVFKYGDVPDEQVGCLQRLDNRLIITTFGEIQGVTGVYQTTVEGKYTMLVTS